MKKKCIYEIKSIEQNKKYSGTTIWNLGYTYTYNPVSNAIGYLMDSAAIFNRKAMKKDKVEVSIIETYGNDECVIRIIGSKKSIQSFSNTVLAKPLFLQNFSIRQKNCWC